MSQQQSDPQRSKSSTSPRASTTGGHGGPTPGVPSVMNQKEQDTSGNQASSPTGGFDNGSSNLQKYTKTPTPPSGKPSSTRNKNFRPKGPFVEDRQNALTQPEPDAHEGQGRKIYMMF